MNKTIWNKNICHYIIALAWLVLLGIGLWLDLNSKIFILPHIPTVDTIITILLPTVITIISISLTLYRQNVCGVKGVRFNKLRIGFHYEFVQMISIMIAIIALYAFLSFFHLKYCIVCLDFISLSYVTFFSFTEIPLLAQQDKAVYGVINDAFTYYIIDEDHQTLEYGEERLILNEVLTNQIFSLDIQTVYSLLKTGNKEEPRLLIHLFRLEEKFFLDFETDLPSWKDMCNNCYQGIDALKA
ncbi:MAG: hypothetical protein WC196_02200 [Bacilli bacterium]